jgi:hypothetical protein
MLYTASILAPTAKAFTVPGVTSDFAQMRATLSVLSAISDPPWQFVRSTKNAKAQAIQSQSIAL